MLQYQEMEQLAYEYRRVDLKVAEEHHLQRLIQPAQPGRRGYRQQLAYAVGQRLLQWGHALHGRQVAPQPSTSTVVMVAK
jgi:hypothetical protein